MTFTILEGTGTAHHRTEGLAADRIHLRWCGDRALPGAHVFAVINGMTMPDFC